MNNEFKVRIARADDLPQLIAIENACFNTDLLSKRSFKHFIKAGSHDLFVLEKNKKLAGYILALYRTGTNLARMYSIAIHPDFRGLGLAHLLVSAAEKKAASRRCIFMRLEVNVNNRPAIALYEKLGYRNIGVIEEYYEDGADAFQMEKRLQAMSSKSKKRKPYYEQTTDFTCGPASLMMAMKTLDPQFKFSRHEELNIWREATTIFMTTGHGGCSPHGLALSAWKRGFVSTLYINQETAPFIDGVRDEDKKTVIELVHEDFLSQIKKTDIEVKVHNLSAAEVKEIVATGDPVLALISTWRLNRNKAPHWVYVADADEDFVYINDPDIDDEQPFVTETDYREVPIDAEVFAKMAKFGQRRLSCFLVIHSKRKK